MTEATLGDLLRSAGGHLDTAAGLPDAALLDGSVIAVTRQACRVVAAMSHYLDDIVPYSDYEKAARPRMEPWMRAAVDAREALTLVAANLDPDASSPGSASGHGAAAADPLEASLTRAATSLIAGRDLLHTHFVTGADGIRSGHSDWSAVVTSVPVTRALLDEIASWSRPLAILAGQLTLASAADPAIPVPVREGLARSRRWLLVAGAAIKAGQRDHPVTAMDIALLHAIPANALPKRRAPGEAEPAAELCEGIAASARRLRLIAHRTAGQAAWPPKATAASWRWTAKAAGIICHISETALRPLADGAGHTTGQEIGGAELDPATEAVAHTGARWRQVAAAWNLMTTETHGLNAPGITDTGDLVIRLGRLVYGDPQWTPSRPQHAQRRDPADLPPGPASAAMIVAAVHEAADALACVAAAELQAVEAASRAGRLYVPTRSLPERYDVPRQFGNATPDGVLPLLFAYRQAASASLGAARALDTVAVTLGAPSHILAAARAAVDPAHDTSAPWSETGQLPDLARTPSDPRNAEGRRLAGPVEQAVRRELVAPDPVLVLRAAAIDKAARELIAKAKEASRQLRTPRQPEDAARTGQPERTAARLAAQSFPQEPATSPAGQHGTGPPVPAAAPGPRRHPLPQGRRHLR